MSAAVIPFPGPVSLDLSEPEIEQVHAALTDVVTTLRQQCALDRRARGYLDHIIAELIDIVDQLDGDPDLEPYLAGQPGEAQGFGVDCEIECEDEGAQCEDEGAQCDDEGVENDSGLADASGAVEQGHGSAWGVLAVV